MSIRRWLLSLVLGLGGSLAVAAGPVAAQDCPLPPLGCTTTTTTSEPTTTESVPATTASTTTSTTVRSTTTTARPAPTTTEAPVADDPTTTSTATTLGTTTTASIPLLVDGPPVDPGLGADSTTSTTALASVPASSDSSGKTGRQVALAVSGLLVLAVVFGALTIWYWRRTKPRVAPARTRSQPTR